MITEMGNSQNQPPGDFGEAIVAPVQEASKCSHLKDSQAEGEIHPTPDSHPGTTQAPSRLKGPFLLGSLYLSQPPVPSSSGSPRPPEASLPKQVPPGTGKLTHSMPHVIGL